MQNALGLMGYQSLMLAIITALGVAGILHGSWHYFGLRAGV